jgi:hypothetical protein
VGVRSQRSAGPGSRLMGRAGAQRQISDARQQATVALMGPTGRRTVRPILGCEALLPPPPPLPPHRAGAK